MNLTPPDRDPSAILHDLANLYQQTHEELFALESYGPTVNEQESVQLAIAERRRILRALATAMAGHRITKVGLHLLPLGGMPISMN